MPRLTARREVRYAGKTYLPGASFDASDKDARLLTRLKNAPCDPFKAPSTPQTAAPTPSVPLNPAPPARATLTAPPAAAARLQREVRPAPTDEPDTDKEEEREAGRYGRRDMRAIDE